MSMSEDESKRLGMLTTAKHRLAIHGMAKDSIKVPTGYKITSAAISAVRADGCDLRVTLCQGDLCMVREQPYRFSPPLRGGDLEASLNARMVELRKKACEPRLHWMVTDRLAFWIMLLIISLGVGTVVDLVAVLEKAPRLEVIIIGIFGSTTNFATAVAAFFWFAVVAHLLEASFAVYFCTSVLELGAVATAKWFFMVFVIGIYAFMDIYRDHAKSKKSK